MNGKYKCPNTKIGNYFIFCEDIRDYNRTLRMDLYKYGYQWDCGESVLCYNPPKSKLGMYIIVLDDDKNTRKCCTFCTNGKFFSSQKLQNLSSILDYPIISATEFHNILNAIDHMQKNIADLI